METLGASMLASAGIIGIVAGVAAQSTLGNLFAGLQIAFGDMVRIGDTVVVDGEWGVVEEVTLTFLTVRTWDERRITMPVSYFTSKPFENWSRGGAQMTGTVFFHLDHSAPVGLMREKLHGDPAGVRGMGRPGLEPGGHGHDAHHDPGPGRGHGQGRGRPLDGAVRRTGADDRLAVREASLRAAADRDVPGRRDGASVPPPRDETHEGDTRARTGRG